MTPDLNVWVALHEQDKKEVAAIQFVEDQLSKKEVALRASKTTVGKQNQVGSKREQQLSTCVAHMNHQMLFASLASLRVNI